MQLVQFLSKFTYFRVDILSFKSSILLLNNFSIKNKKGMKEDIINAEDNLNEVVNYKEMP